jgi:8-oxo-dGTP pyrophosphatase MutT (NUDIX family)
MDPIRMTMGYLIEREHLTMIHRIRNEEDFHYGMWIVPGGHLEGLELPDNCLKREFKEEVGVEIEHMSRIGMVYFDNQDRTKPNGEPFKFNAEVFFYRIDDFKGIHNSHDDKGNPIYRVPLGHVYTKPMHEGDKFLWTAIRQNPDRQFDAYIKHNGTKLDKKRSRIQLR